MDMKEGIMAKVLIKVNVAYPDEFIKTFESQTPTREQNGERIYTSAVDEDIHNYVYVICDWESVQKAKQFWASDEAGKHVKSWNAVGSPEIKILRESPED